MGEARFHFHGVLNDLLPAEKRDTAFIHSFQMKASIKDTIEAFGVPHTEIDLLAVAGRFVDFQYIVKDGDAIDVYPPFTKIEASADVRLWSRPVQTRFLLDIHLGRLAAYLRMLGFDTLYRNDYHDEELAAIADREARILLTRDVGLLKRNLVKYGYWVRATDPEKQLVEVLGRYGPSELEGRFQRCLRCNEPLVEIAKDEIIDRLQPKTIEHYSQFSICPACQRIFWKGSHYQKMERLIARLQTQIKPTSGKKEEIVMNELAQKECIPCKGGVPPLTGAEQDELMKRLGNGWHVVNGHHLEKEYKFPDFRGALEFTIKVGELAEQQWHHPDIYLAWGKVGITIWTHKIDGLTESDFILAAKIDTLLS